MGVPRRGSWAIASVADQRHGKGIAPQSGDGRALRAVGRVEDPGMRPAFARGNNGGVEGQVQVDQGLGQGRQVRGTGDLAGPAV